MSLTADELKTDVLSGWNEIKEISSDWDALCLTSNATIFQTFDWTEAWLQAFGQNIQPFIITVRHQGHLVGLAVFGKTKSPIHRWAPWWKIDTIQFLSDFRVPTNQFMVAPGYTEAAEKILISLCRHASRGTEISLANFRDWHNYSAAFASLGMRAVSIFKKNAPSSIIVDISKGYDAYLETKNRQFRKNIRTTFKKIEKTDYKILDHTQDPEIVLGRIMDLSRSSWKGQAGSSFGRMEGGDLFIHDLWKRFGEKNMMQFYLLEIEGRAVASNITLVFNNNGYGYLTEFDEAYRDLSPGRFIIAYGLQVASQHGLKSVDFLRRTHFTRFFSDDMYELKQFNIFPYRNIAYGLFKTRKHLSRITSRYSSEKKRKRSNWLSNADPGK